MMALCKSQSCIMIKRVQIVFYLSLLASECIVGLVLSGGGIKRVGKCLLGLQSLASDRTIGMSVKVNDKVD